MVTCDVMSFTYLLLLGLSPVVMKEYYIGQVGGEMMVTRGTVLRKFIRIARAYPANMYICMYVA